MKTFFVRIELKKKKEIYSLVAIQDCYPSKSNAKFNWTGALQRQIVLVIDTMVKF